MTKTKIKKSHCPRCKGPMSAYPALSRKDNKTEICSECGTREALEAYVKEMGRK